MRLPSSRCDVTPAARWSWPVRRRANARTAAAREGQDLRSRGYYTATRVWARDLGFAGSLGVSLRGLIMDTQQPLGSRGGLSSVPTLDLGVPRVTAGKFYD